MNPDILETLLIDRALGRHSPEVEALLAEHLATDRAAAKLAAELQDVVALAAAALHRPVPTLTPPPRIKGRFWFARANRVFAMAASLAVGAGLALVVERTVAPHSEPTLTHQPAEPPPARSTANVNASPEIAKAARALPFWSQQRAYLLAGAAKETAQSLKPR